MSWCPLCGNKGVIRIRYQTSDDCDYGICLCAKGLPLRKNMEALAAKLGIFAESIGYVEQLLDAEDFPPGMASAPKPIADIAEAGRVGGGKKARL